MEPLRLQNHPAEEDRTGLVAADGFPKFPKGSLRGFERISEPLVRFVNRTGWFKALVEFFVLPLSGAWIRWIARPRIDLVGLEPLRDLRPPRGIILVSNHRSFFDMYLATSFLRINTPFIRRQTFPVRSNFFYERFTGLLINLAISGCSMWPPVFRDDRKYDLNPISMAQTCFVASKPGAVMGYHPEGTRGKGPDPYEFLPAKPGIGKIVHGCHADTLVLPFFILGASNDLLNDIKIRRKPESSPIRLTFSRPIRCEALRKDRDALAISEHLMATIHDMAIAYRDELTP